MLIHSKCRLKIRPSISVYCTECLPNEEKEGTAKKILGTQSRISTAVKSRAVNGNSTRTLNSNEVSKRLSSSSSILSRRSNTPTQNTGKGDLSISPNKANTTNVKKKCQCSCVEATQTIFPEWEIILQSELQSLHNKIYSTISTEIAAINNKVTRIHRSYFENF